MTMQRAAEQLAHEMANWQAVRWQPGWRGKHEPAFVITSNVRGTHSNGRPFASSREVRRDGDPAVAVWWLERVYETDEDPIVRVIACDGWPNVAANLRACGVTIESIRAMERAGASEAIKRATWGFKAPALPSAGAAPAARARPWWADRLGLDPDKPYTMFFIHQAWRRCVAVEHPDKGGDHEAFLDLERARAEAMQHANREEEVRDSKKQESGR
jgi:hypothetical protein